jgi:hypothetical protein
MGCAQISTNVTVTKDGHHLFVMKLDVEASRDFQAPWVNASVI